MSSDLHFGTPCTGSRENSPISRYGNSTYTSSTLPRKSGLRSKDSSRKASRSSLGKSQLAVEHKTEEKPQEIEETTSPKLSDILGASITEKLKTSPRYTNSNFSHEDNTSSAAESPVKHLSNIDNSGPSSIESHKSSKTGSSLTSGPSSLESHKTVINRALESPKVDSRTIKKHYRKDSSKSRNIQKTTSTLSPSHSMPHSNSFTLQVTTNQGGLNLNNKTNATTTATINGGAAGNTKIFVQNSPVRSVITFENGQSDQTNPNVVIINGEGVESSKAETTTTATRESNCDLKPAKNTNHLQESQQSLNNSRDTINHDSKCDTMNNSRKLSLQMPSKESLSYHNLIKNVSSRTHNQYNSNSNPDSPIANTFRELSKNPLFTSSPPSPTKSYEGIPMLSSGKYIKNEVGSKTSLEKSFNGLDSGKELSKNIIGSEPNICYKEKTLTRENSNHQFPSLSDLSFNFTSLAAQKILKGVSINSVDTLVELNMAAGSEKQNNCEVVHTDFGLF